MILYPFSTSVVIVKYKHLIFRQEVWLSDRGGLCKRSSFILKCQPIRQAETLQGSPNAPRSQPIEN